MKWSSVCLWPAGVVWSPDEGVAALAGRSDRAAEEEGDWGQTAVGQQARQTAAGQRRDSRGTTRAKINTLKIAQARGWDAWKCWSLLSFDKTQNNVWVMNGKRSYCSLYELHYIIITPFLLTLLLSGHSKAHLLDFTVFCLMKKKITVKLMLRWSNICSFTLSWQESLWIFNVQVYTWHYYTWKKNDYCFSSTYI